MKVGLRKDDALCQSMWIIGVILIVTNLKLIWSPSLVGDTTGF